MDQTMRTAERAAIETPSDETIQHLARTWLRNGNVGDEESRASYARVQAGVDAAIKRAQERLRATCARCGGTNEVSANFSDTMDYTDFRTNTCREAIWAGRDRYWGPERHDQAWVEMVEPLRREEARLQRIAKLLNGVKRISGGERVYLSNPRARAKTRDGTKIEAGTQGILIRETSGDYGPRALVKFPAGEVWTSPDNLSRSNPFGGWLTADESTEPKLAKMGDRVRFEGEEGRVFWMKGGRLGFRPESSKDPRAAKWANVVDVEVLS